MENNKAKKHVSILLTGLIGLILLIPGIVPIYMIIFAGKELSATAYNIIDTSCILGSVFIVTFLIRYIKLRFGKTE